MSGISSSRTRLWRVAVFAIVIVFGLHCVFASVAGSSSQQCGDKGVLYTNSSPLPLNFNVSVQNGTSAACALTLTWKDSSKHARTITLAPGTATSFATSLPSNDAISWSLDSGSGRVIVVWQVEPR